MWRESRPQLWPHFKNTVVEDKEMSAWATCAQSRHSRHFGASPERGSTSQETTHCPEQQTVLSGESACIEHLIEDEVPEG